jgi:four helix bundle protein
METDHWIGIAASCGYLEEQTARKLMGEANKIGRMLNSMMKKSSDFCALSKDTES